ncbi:Glycosyltransferase subfamily 4-like, N-terminal domain protein [Acididesulfobacillus acetoxydans]|uniref:GDP-mannose-dependent alpha-mannosyltransferase n=1 Tax=Acididesulfobacillus acetoxydans TaxID=1561005 RepID=A0A8S0W2A1_9FIRM|nr:glycosyltransferase family 1 protein [Acididesulfobacillus acetoxydans]CAA7600538.1 Glycosyltransferase subfamily 4-like, N-terminal domain protein [Acididesulfobacillus acetoxydans]CEJ06672.1 GDP-mannose-dependent alpha-mannosyltransferase [Acididesulfobacillus acetoxydans]
MKIAIITETFLPSTDGVVTRLCASIRWLRRNGHEVLVIAPDLGEQEYMGAKVAGVPARSFFFYPDRKFSLPTAKVKKYLREFQPDLVHAVNPAFLGLAGVYYSRRLRLPLVASYHTNIAQYMKFYHLSFLQPLTWKYLQLLHNQARLNLCTSRAVQNALTERGFRNVHVWSRGVALDRFHPSHRENSWRERLSNGHPEKLLLLYVGRLAPEKGIEGIRPLLTKSADFCLALVGDGPHRQALEKHFQGTQTVFTGFLHGEDLAKAYASSDIFLFPSLTDTLGLVILEAMASGLPVIAADSGPAREQIAPAINGLLYNPAQAESLEQAVEDLRDQQVRRDMGGRARATAAEFGWERPAEQLLQFYRQALAGDPVPAQEPGLTRGRGSGLEASPEPGQILRSTGHIKR